MVFRGKKINDYASSRVMDAEQVGISFPPKSFRSYKTSERIHLNLKDLKTVEAEFVTHTNSTHTNIYNSSYRHNETYTA